jgi:DNA repair exonuclease SbcCD nuclease subunit
MTKFLHSADWQLGMTRHFLTPEAQARFTAARLEAIRTIGALAVAEDCGFVVVCGDVFETNQVARQIVVRALDAMASTPSVRFYLLPGNHDPLDASSVFRSATFVHHVPSNVVVLDQPGPVAIESGVVLVAAPWFSKRPLTDLVAGAARDLPASATVRIAVGHGAIDSLSPDGADPAVIALAGLEADLDAGRLHYVALGDRHSTTDVGRTGRIFYSGAPEPTDYDEIDPGNVLLVDVSTDAVSVRRQSIGTWQFRLERFDLAGAADCARLQSWLHAIEDKARTIVKLALVGQLSLAEKAQLDGIIDHHTDLLAALETWERRSDLVVLPDDGDLEHLGLSGFAREALEDLRVLASNEVAARDALGLLYRLGHGLLAGASR